MSNGYPITSSIFGNYDKVHYYNISDVMVLLVVSEINTFIHTSMGRWQHNQLSLHNLQHKSLHRGQANFAGVKHHTFKGLYTRINPDKPPETSDMPRRLLTSKLGQRLTIRSFLDLWNEEYSQ
jgi:hypothetical protein